MQKAVCRQQWSVSVAAHTGGMVWVHALATNGSHDTGTSKPSECCDSMAVQLSAVCSVVPPSWCHCWLQALTKHNLQTQANTKRQESSPTKQRSSVLLSLTQLVPQLVAGLPQLPLPRATLRRRRHLALQAVATQLCTGRDSCA